MSRDINELHPKVADLCRTLIAKCKEQGIDILITQTYRNIAEQNELYAQGRTKPGKIVTNAKGGYSFHNYRMAFDFVPLTNGKPNWNDVNLFNKVGAIGKSLGLEWGGDWQKFKDRPHFQYTFGMSLSDLRLGKWPNKEEVHTVEQWKIDAINKAIEKGYLKSNHDPAEKVDMGTMAQTLDNFRESLIADIIKALGGGK